MIDYGAPIGRGPAYEPGARVKQAGGSRRTGTITQGIWSGYVTVQWDSGKEESGIHIADIKVIETLEKP
jgi:hypothetical protein